MRAVIYFAGWSGIASTAEQAGRGGRTRATWPSTRAIQRLSGAGLVFYALAVTFAGIDWIMSLNPHWYSTLFGFLMMGGQGLAALAFTIIVVDVPRASASRCRVCSSRITSTTSAS